MAYPLNPEAVRNVAIDLARRCFETACPCAYPRICRLLSLVYPGPIDIHITSTLSGLLAVGKRMNPGSVVPPLFYQEGELGRDELPSHLAFGREGELLECPICGSTWLYQHDEYGPWRQRQFCFLIDSRAPQIGVPASDPLPIIGRLEGFGVDTHAIHCELRDRGIFEQTEDPETFIGAMLELAQTGEVVSPWAYSLDPEAPLPG